MTKAAVVYLELLNAPMPEDFTVRLQAAGITSGGVVEAPEGVEPKISDTIWLAFNGEDPTDLVNKAIAALDLPIGTTFRWQDPVLIEVPARA